MSMVLKEVSDFCVQAFHKDKFLTVTKKDIVGKWSVFFFYPADFTKPLDVPENLGDFIIISY